MKFWLSKNSEIPVRRQLAAQILLGVASGDLQIGAKLPSTSEIARRFQIHSNTVRSAYRELAADGLLEYRQGSGFYVRENENQENVFGLDRLIADFLHRARAKGHEPQEIRQRLENWFEMRAPELFLVIENNADLRAILIEEISEASDHLTEGCDFAEFQSRRSAEAAVFVALNDETGKLKPLLPPGKDCVFLKTSSVTASMRDQPRPPADDLIAVVSGWSDFLVWTKTMLVAAQIDHDSLILRSTADRNWRRGLEGAAIIICDTLAAKQLPDDPRRRIFPVIADESLTELRRMIG